MLLCLDMIIKMLPIF